MTIHLSRRKLVVGFLAVVMIAAACYIAFLVGQTTRITEADATSRTNTAVEKAVRTARGEETAKRHVEVKAAKTAARKHETRRVKKLNRRWKSRLARETEKARQAGVNSGYASGQTAGFASGREQGEASGREEGFEDGLDAGSDELDCSDDIDIYWLPSCNF